MFRLEDIRSLGASPRPFFGGDIDFGGVSEASEPNGDDRRGDREALRLRFIGGERLREGELRRSRLGDGERRLRIGEGDLRRFSSALYLPFPLL